MTLAPKLPPGRANRKALQYAFDIHRLRNAGYTFSAIRMALLDAGISVSLSTVKREAARRETDPIGAQPMSAAQRAPSTTVPSATSLDVPPARPLVPMVASARQIAETFFNAHPANPLLRTQDLP